MNPVKSVIVSIKILSTIVFGIDKNKKCFSSTKSAYIKMISVGSCDDWSNEVAGINYILKYITIDLFIYFCNNIFKKSVFTVFLNQINTALESIRDTFHKHYKILPTPNFWMVVYCILFILLLLKCSFKDRQILQFCLLIKINGHY